MMGGILHAACGRGRARQRAAQFYEFWRRRCSGRTGTFPDKQAPYISKIMAPVLQSHYYRVTTAAEYLFLKKYYSAATAGRRNPHDHGLSCAFVIQGRYDYFCTWTSVSIQPHYLRGSHVRSTTVFVSSRASSTTVDLLRALHVASKK